MGLREASAVEGAAPRDVPGQAGGVEHVRRGQEGGVGEAAAAVPADPAAVVEEVELRPPSVSASEGNSGRIIGLSPRSVSYFLFKRPQHWMKLLRVRDEGECMYIACRSVMFGQGRCPQRAILESPF